MRAEFKGTSRRPVAISDDSVANLTRLFADIRERVLHQLSSTHGFDLDRVRLLASEPHKPLAMPEYPSEEGDKARDAYARQSLEYVGLESLRRDLVSKTSFEANVGYVSGSTFATDSISALTDVLRTEPGVIDSLSFAFGERFAGLHVSVRLYNSRTTAYFSITGERDDVDHVNLALRKWLRTSEPDHPLLHNSFAAWLPVVLLIAVASTFLATWLDRLVGWGPKRALATTLLINGVLSITVGLFLMAQLEKTFPKLQVELGPQWKRIRAQRAFLLVLVTALLLPTIIGLLLR